MEKNIIVVEDAQIRFYQEKEEDFISLTDVARKFSERTGQLILNWLRTRSTINFLGTWEKLHNPDFNVLNFENIRSLTGEATFVLSLTDWMERTNAIGVRAKTGRYGGTYAHRDIAFEFMSYLDPAFKLYVFKEFQRLKTIESAEKKDNLDWSFKRMLAKVNYDIHTEAVQEYLLPPRIGDIKTAGLVFASEADLLNVALFGMTARQWKTLNPDLKGNLRDYSTAEQLLVLANLENLNAHLIREGFAQDERLQKLNEVAIHQMHLLANSKKMGDLKRIAGKEEVE